MISYKVIAKQMANFPWVLLLPGKSSYKVSLVYKLRKAELQSFLVLQTWIFAFLVKLCEVVADIVFLTESKI